MKKPILLLIILSVFFTSVLSVSAYDKKDSTKTVSPALAVLADDFGMVRTAFTGSNITFSASDFEGALGVSELRSIAVVSLPPASAGRLMLGSIEVMEGQSISRDNIAALTFIPKDKTVKECTFTVRLGNSQKYDLPCTVCMISKHNFTPAASTPEQVSTYKNIAYFGKLGGSDPDGDEISYRIVSSTTKGIVRLTDDDGSFLYCPVANFTGNDSFTYTLTDKYGNESEPVKVRLSVVRSENGTVFNDLIDNPCHNDAITLSDKGIIAGRIEDGLEFFDPDGNMTREEFLSMAVKAAGIKAEENAKVGFSDVSEIGKNELPYVAAAVKLGYISAEDGEFRPTDKITVGEAENMASSILDFSVSVSTSPEDNSQSAPLTREEAVSLLMNIYREMKQ